LHLENESVENKEKRLFSHLVDEKSFLSFRHSPVFTGAGSAEAGIQRYLNVISYVSIYTGFPLPRE